MNIVTAFSFWLLIPVLLIGLMYAAILYFRNRKAPFSKQLRFILFLLRWLAVSLMAFLLLNPLLMLQKKAIEQPIILIAHDNSASLVLNKDSLFYKKAYLSKLDSLISALESNFRVEQYTFGKNPVQSKIINFTEQQTDMASLLQMLKTAYYRKNVGGLILLSDGINNSGIQPELLASTLSFPVFSVGLGDTTFHPDIQIVDIRYNKLVFNKSDFPVEVSIKASAAYQKIATVSLFVDGIKIRDHVVTIPNNRFAFSHTFNVSVTESGKKKLSVVVQGVENELTTSNNKRDFYVDVINQKQQILVLAQAPHPDLAAIKSVFSDYFEPTIEYIQTWKPDTKPYSLIILHQLPAVGSNSTLLLDYLKQNVNTPLWLIVGRQTDFMTLNRLQDAIQLHDVALSGTIDLVPVPTQGFTLFSVDDFQKERIKNFPALVAPMATYVISGAHSNFLNQRVKGIETNFPLLGFFESSSRRIGFVAGTGIWRWKLADFSQNGNHEVFNDIISKSINYLIIKNDNRRLRLFAEAEFVLNDDIGFKAELYNPSFEMVNDVDVDLSIRQKETKAAYEYKFSKSENSYWLNAGRLPAGEYNYVAKAILGNENLQNEGSFVVLESTIEGYNMVADHQLLYRIAAQTGGAFVSLNEMSRITEILKSDTRVTSVATYTKQFNPLSQIAWMLALLLALISAEWILRKLFGSY